jgi:hypothetical protein
MKGNKHYGKRNPEKIQVLAYLKSNHILRVKQLNYFEFHYLLMVFRRLGHGLCGIF